SLGVLITYSGQSEESPRLQLVGKGTDPNVARENSVSIGLLGAGSFAMGTLLPAMKGIGGLDLIGVCAANGSHSRHAADKFGFQYCATDEEQILSDSRINTVVIATRHHLHASQVLAALSAGKHVFCEKPLCLSEDELAEIVRTYHNVSARQKPLLMIGFNRRFAPMAIRMKSFVKEIQQPLTMHYRVNAGSLHPDHWVNDPQQGGGRILGEVCHFVDFLSFLAGAPPSNVQANDGGVIARTDDHLVISLQFANGSQGTISYLANGDKSYSKERLEVFGGGRVAVLEDFRRLELVRQGRKRVFRSLFWQDKGHSGEWKAFATALRTGAEAPIPFDEIVSTTLATLRVLDSRASGRTQAVNSVDFIHSDLSSLRPD
ncbi:MAG TPA: Gfo/Idh/MocA family oxidoreductase, partial [Terriglobales bacterium]|nr:Gfo/Idh/MocA family oxidoreductase [Terriglobales bacterium]